MAIDRDNLESTIEKSIMNDEACQPHWKTDVIEDSGVVTLGGVVPKEEDRQIVEAIVCLQKGVVTGINEIDVDPGLKRHPEEKLLEDKLEVQVPPRDKSPAADR